MFEKSLGDDYRWGVDGNVVKAWFRLKGIKTKFFAIVYVLIGLLAKIRTYSTLRKIRKNESLDYWKVSR